MFQKGEKTVSFLLGKGDPGQNASCPQNLEYVQMFPFIDCVWHFCQYSCNRGPAWNFCQDSCCRSPAWYFCLDSLCRSPALYFCQDSRHRSSAWYFYQDSCRRSSAWYFCHDSCNRSPVIALNLGFLWHLGDKPKFVFSSDVILCGWLGLKCQLTNSYGTAMLVCCVGMKSRKRLTYDVINTCRPCSWCHRLQTTRQRLAALTAVLLWLWDINLLTY